MLTLLKIDATGLPVPDAAPKADVRIGQWAIALGRALDANPDRLPSVSVGIISALDRIWGKAMQTDAKVSPVNYGGPLVDIDGRVLGMLVPAVAARRGETAGVEWYDSGIGFADPARRRARRAAPAQGGQGPAARPARHHAEIDRSVRRRADHRHGRPGIGRRQSRHASGDVIIEIDGKPVANQSQLLQALGPKYEGDVISLRIRRGKEEINFDKIVLGGVPSAFIDAVPRHRAVRDDPELGVEVRYVYPKSPADDAGIKPGDRIMKVGGGDAKELRPFSGRDELRTILDTLSSATEIKLEVKRKADDKTETLKLKLGALPDDVPEAAGERDGKHASSRASRCPGRRPLPAPVDRPKNEEKPKTEPKPEEKKAETGFLERSTPAKDHKYWLYVPNNYDPNVSHALVIWLHAAGKGGKDAKDMVSIWRDACEDQHIILVGPKSESETGWLASEAEFVQEAAREVMKEYTIDRQRVVAHGMGVGGQLAFYLGFNARDLVRGVATTGAVLATTPKDNSPASGLRSSSSPAARTRWPKKSPRCNRNSPRRSTR